MSGVSKIPIQNIYYLLCYAWNRLEERDVVDVSGIDTTSLVDLFAKVLSGGIERLLRRGLDRGYVEYAEDTRCLRGKLLFCPTLKRNLLMKAQVHCEFDELSHNVLHNKILKTTLRQMIRVESLDRQLKDRLIGLYRRFHEVDEIELSSPVFSRVQLHRNNAFYDFLLKICELVYSIIEDQSGVKYLQIDTYGSAIRKMPGKKSQSLRFSPQAIQKLKQIIDREF